MTSIESAGCTDIGRVRSNNEDFFLVSDASKLFIVADGMGGHQSGEVASRLVVEHIRDFWSRAGADISEEILPNADAALSDEANRLAAAITFSNWNIHEFSHTHQTYWKMGSTVAAVLVTETTLIAANVGDSPIYLVHGDHIELISVIHNVAAELAARGHPESTIAERYRNMLTRAMGIDDVVEPYICEAPFFDGDIVVMATDGLSNKVSPEEIRRIVRDMRPEAACRYLVNLANERGGEDNITVIILALALSKSRWREAVMDIRSKIRYGMQKLRTYFKSSTMYPTPLS